ncbi:MAG: hypothetical protein AB7U73_21935 [Pirellulales bacterium]
MRCAYCQQEIVGEGVLDRYDTGNMVQGTDGHTTETIPVLVCPACVARRSAIRQAFWWMLVVLILGMILIAGVVTAFGLSGKPASQTTGAERAPSTPNPQQAPWYFSGPADWIVQADPWFAGTLVFLVAGAVLLVVAIVVPLVVWLILRTRSKP